VTDLRATQGVVEVWLVTSSAAERLTQLLVECWIMRVPPTSEVVTQMLAEVWANFTTPTTRVTATQLLIEVWLGSPTMQPLRVSSQVI
jgi:hypothetical protein